MGRRHRARELALKVLFHMEYNRCDPDEGFNLICDTFGPSTSSQPFSRELVLGVCQNREKIDDLIVVSSRHWRLERMSRVDRNILRLAVFELLKRKDIPPKVTIDEAVELAKSFGTNDSGSFINGVLDNIYNRIKPEGTEEENNSRESKGNGKP